MIIFFLCACAYEIVLCFVFLSVKHASCSGELCIEREFISFFNINFGRYIKIAALMKMFCFTLACTNVFSYQCISCNLMCLLIHWIAVLIAWNCYKVNHTASIFHQIDYIHCYNFYLVFCFLYQIHWNALNECGIY